MARAAAVAGVQPAVLEPIQVVRYLPGQSFDVHVDAWPQSQAYAMGGNRNLTLFVYLSETPEEETGGSTVFPDLGLRLRPRLGSAVLWANLAASGEFDPRMKHIGEAPTLSTKFGLNVWLWDREIPQDGSRPQPLQQPKSEL